MTKDQGAVMSIGDQIPRGQFALLVVLMLSIFSFTFFATRPFEYHSNDVYCIRNSKFEKRVTTYPDPFTHVTDDLATRPDQHDVSEESSKVDVPSERGDSCAPSTSVFLLKLHKCASTTVQNILLRFGMAHQLNFLLPVKGNYIGNPRRFDRNMVTEDMWPVLEEKFDIFTYHTRFNDSEIRYVMKPEAKFITIVRNPVDIFESMYDYYRLDKLYSTDFKTFLDMDFKQKMNVSQKGLKRFWGKIGRNQMLFDMGFDETQFDNLSAVNNFIDKIERSFDLVMISDHMEASLVLLCDLLCWNLTDVAHFHLNGRIASAKTILNEKQRIGLEKYLHADVMLYNRFLSVFRERVEAYNVTRMLQDITSLQFLNEGLRSRCVANVTTRKNLLPVEYRPYGWNTEGFSLREPKSVECENMVKSELYLTEEIRKFQTRRFSELKYLIRNLEISPTRK